VSLIFGGGGIRPGRGQLALLLPAVPVRVFLLPAEFFLFDFGMAITVWVWAE